MRQWTIDAFASGPFRGNPACVIEPFDAWPDEAWMQAVAAENNQGATAFLVRTGARDAFDIRWLTPKMEVPLCGHATLAAAHVLTAELGVKAESFRFATREAGALTVKALDGGRYEMDFPAQPPRRIAPPAGLAEVLGVELSEVWAASYVIAVLDDEALVRGVNPDLTALEPIARGVTGRPGNVAVTSPARTGSDFDVVSRFFAPGFGLAEDPVTGSLHCMLTPLYAQKLGRHELDFFQAFPGRGGELNCEHRGDRVLLRGKAVVTLEGVLRV